ncbi:MAG: translational GTPase TypA [Ruminococcaceae bacterium]|nr:translational GTPase TypA [Oscillospiraceae bacterium]
MIREDLRNIAIIAHVDHGKTTLVDELLKQCGAFRQNQAVADRVMDSGDLERERGITILSKNTAVNYKGIKLNIVDTPGHADFGGEVERVLKMVNGVLLLVDAYEGPMPQTRFVLQRALELGLKAVIVINKVDRPDARCDEVVDEILELLFDLDATDEQLDSPVLFASARAGFASLSPYEHGDDMTPLLDTIVSHIPAPEGDENAPLQMLVSSIDYNEYVGRIAVGRIENGILKQNSDILLTNYHATRDDIKAKAVNLYTFEGLKRVPIESAQPGDIIALSGLDTVNIGDTICDPLHPQALPFVKISEPTVEMAFSINDSPFAGREGKFVTSRNLRDRLFRELLKDVSLKVEETESTDTFRVLGRGEMHLSILIETMRREGYEFQVGAPKVLFRKDEDGNTTEPFEEVVVDVPASAVGAVMEKLNARKGELTKMGNVGTRTRLEFLIPSRGLFGYRSEFLTDTRGEGILNTIFHGYLPTKGDFTSRQTGSLIAFETGESITYGLFNAQERGALFIGAGVPVYAGMVVGLSPKGEDIVVNVCKKKHATNMRASGSDDALRLIPPRTMSLEQCIEFLAEDELLEVTPKSLRIRKTVLDHGIRAAALAKKRAKQQQ